MRRKLYTQQTHGQNTTSGENIEQYLNNTFISMAEGKEVGVQSNCILLEETQDAQEEERFRPSPGEGMKVTMKKESHKRIKDKTTSKRALKNLSPTIKQREGTFAPAVDFMDMNKTFIKFTK